MEMDKIFFGESGLTSTSANHIANVAKEWIQTVESEISDVSLYDKKVSLIGSDVERFTQRGIGYDSLSSFVKKLEMVSCAKSIIAWLREAIKARQRLINEVDKKTLEEYAKENGIELEEEPVKEDPITENDYIASLSVKERNRYYALGTLCATIGQYIHPNGTLSDKRKELADVKNHPSRTTGSGRDMVIYDYIPTVTIEQVDELFFNLQKKHREAQAELNSIKFRIEKAVTDDKIAKNAEYEAKYSDWSTKHRIVSNAFASWKVEEVKRLSSLKIIIPNDLRDVYDFLSKLGE